MPEYPPLFDETKCSDAVADLVNFDFISDCTILPAPPPIFDCPDIEIPPEPPIPIVPCPTFTPLNPSGTSVTTSGKVTLRTEDCDSKFDVTGTALLEFIQDDCCNFIYDLDLDLNFDVELCIPPFSLDVPCPYFTATATATITTEDSSAGLSAPCNASPQVNVTVETLRGFSVSSSQPICDIELVFGFDFLIPPPKVPCPAITGNATATTNGTSGSGQPCGGPPLVTVELTVTDNASNSSLDPCNPDCEFNLDFNFDFVIPKPEVPCPLINASATGTATAGTTSLGTSAPLCGGEPQADVLVSLEVLTNEGGTSCEPSCELDFNFDFDFNFGIPKPVIPCPTINATAGATTNGGSNSGSNRPCGGDPEVVVDVTVEAVDGGTSCEPSCDFTFDFNFDFAIPAPIIPCPIINATATATAVGNTSGSSVGSDPCNRQPQVTVELAVDATKGSDSCNPECEFNLDFNFDFVIPPPVVPCPTLTGTATATATAATTQPSISGQSAPNNPTCGGEPQAEANVTLEITQNEAGDSCNPDCEFQFDFGFDFDFVIPKPQPICPTVDGTITATVNGGGALLSSSGGGPQPSISATRPCGGDPAVTAELTITQSTTGEDSCNPSCELDFDFNFDFTIPAPIIPCPVVNGSAALTINGVAQGSGGDTLGGGPSCGGDPTGDFTVAITATTGSDSCNPECTLDFDFDLNLNIPAPATVCPTVNGSATMTINGVEQGYSGAPQNSGCGGDPTGDVTLTITANNSGDSCNPDCTVDFDFDFNFDFPEQPVACPAFSVTASGTVETNGSCGGEPGVDIQVTTTQDPADSCGGSCGTVGLDFAFDFTLPTPAPICPTIDATASGTIALGVGEPHVDVTVAVTPANQGADSCNPSCATTLDFNFDFLLPYLQLSSASLDVITDVFGASIGSSCELVLEYATQTIHYKQAIVPDAAGTPVGLHCVEAPEVWFFDVYKRDTEDTVVVIPIDPTFIAVCEPDSLVVMSVNTGRITPHGAIIHNDTIQCAFDKPPGQIVCTIGGIRKGAKDRRFPQHTVEEMERNNAFWDRSVV